MTDSVYFDGHRYEVPIADPTEADELVGACYFLGGWFGLERERDGLRNSVRVSTDALRALVREGEKDRAANIRAAINRGYRDTAPQLATGQRALAAWEGALARWGTRLAPKVGLVERHAMELAKHRLADAREGLQKAAQRYLVGFDPRIFDAAELSFPETTALARSDDIQALRAAWSSLAVAQRAVDTDKLRAVLTNLAASFSSVLAALLAVLQVRDLLLALTRVAALRSQLAREHAIVLRLAVPTASSDEASPPDDEALLGALRAIFIHVHAAQGAVRSRALQPMFSDQDARAENGPVRALGERLRARGLGGGGGFVARFQRPALGPWEYQALMEDAVSGIAGPGLSLSRLAVRDVYRAADPSLADSFAECGATSAALLACHLICPPLAIVADILLATKGIAENVFSYLQENDAYWCALDPSDSFGLEPSLLRLALRCAGEVAGAIPGSKVGTGVAFIAPLVAEAAP